MISSATRQSTRAKVCAHRRRLRAQGLRPILIWVPDTRTPTFVAAARRQAKAVAASAEADRDRAIIDTVSDLFEA